MLFHIYWRSSRPHVFCYFFLTHHSDPQQSLTEQAMCFVWDLQDVRKNKQPFFLNSWTLFTHSLVFFSLLSSVFPLSGTIGS